MVPSLNTEISLLPFTALFCVKYATGSYPWIAIPFSRLKFFLRIAASCAKREMPDKKTKTTKARIDFIMILFFVFEMNTQHESFPFTALKFYEYKSKMIASLHTSCK